MGKRFTILIGLAAAGVMALGAQRAATKEVVEYDSKVTIAYEPSTTAYDRPVLYGSVESKDAPPDPQIQRGEVSACERWRRVILFRPRPGADRKFGGTWSHLERDRESGILLGVFWRFHRFVRSGSAGPGARIPRDPSYQGRVYAKVTRKVGDGFVCLADYSKTIVAPLENHRR